MDKYKTFTQPYRLFVIGGFYQSPAVHIARLSPAGCYWPTTADFAKGNISTLDRLPDLFDMLDGII